MHVQITWNASTAFDMEADDFPLVAAGGSKISDVVLDDSIPIEFLLKVIPLQVHWHVPSEHKWDGMWVRIVYARSHLF